MKIRQIIVAPNPPTDRIRVAMIEHNGVPIELIEFKRVAGLMG